MTEARGGSGEVPEMMLKKVAKQGCQTRLVEAKLGQCLQARLGSGFNGGIWSAIRV
jgi:hypothetical protein